jgi:hypothetical protein
MSHPKAHLKIVVAERKELSTEEKVGRYGLLERSEGRSTAEGMIEPKREKVRTAEGRYNSSEAREYS